MFPFPSSHVNIPDLSIETTILSVIDNKVWYQPEQTRGEWQCDTKLMVSSIIVVKLWQLKYNILHQRIPEQCIVKLYHNSRGQSGKPLWQWPEGKKVV